jgi:hypothetical protein
MAELRSSSLRMRERILRRSFGLPRKRGPEKASPKGICDGNLPNGQRTVDTWFDRSCFVAVPAKTGRFGNSGVNIIEGQGLNLTHVRMTKRFPVTERI